MKRLLAALVLLIAPLVRGDPAPKVFSHPLRIRYDGQCLTVDGRDTFIFGASFGVFPGTPAEWRERLRSLREAGGNTVEISLGEGADFDLRRFQDALRVAQDEFGFYSIVRPGSRLKEAATAIAAAQLTRRPAGHGGVILVRIENEGDTRALWRAAAAVGIEVPLFTCQNAACRDSSDPVLGQVFDTVISPVRYDPELLLHRIHAAAERQPDAPAMIAGMGGGTLTSAQVAAEAIQAIQGGVTLMVVDGNPLPPIGKFLRAHGGPLTRSHPIFCQAESGSPDVAITARRDRASGTYLFFCNRSPVASRTASAVIWLEHQGEIRLDYELDPLGCKILYLPPHDKDPAHGTLYP